MREVRENLTKSPFKAFDIIVYLSLAALVAAAFVFLSPKAEGKTVEVLIRGEIVLKYDLSNGSASFDGSFVRKISGDEFVVTTEKGYNVVKMDRQAGTAFVSESDCRGGECKNMHLEKGSIICVPHSLVVRYGGEELAPKVG